MNLSKKPFTLLRSLLGLTFLSVCLSGCQEEADQLIAPATEANSEVTPQIQAKIDFIRTTAGFTNETTIQYQEGEFIVNETIIISEEDTDHRMAAGTANVHTEQRRTGSYLVDPQRVRDIKVAFAEALILAFACSTAVV